MKQITIIEYDGGRKYKAEKPKNHVLLQNTSRFICKTNGYDIEMVQQHFLKILTKISPKEE